MIRQKDRLSKGVHRNHYVQPTGSDAVSYQYSFTPNLGSYEYIDSLITRDFKPGKFSINPVTIWKGQGGCTSGSFDFRWPTTADSGTYRKICEGQFAGFRESISSGGTNPNLANYSRVKADAKLNDAVTDLGMMLAELGETLGMLISPFRALARLLKKVKKSGSSSGKSLRKAADSLSNWWLQYRYGVIPLISDIESIMEEFAKKVHMFNLHIRSRRGTVQDSTETKVISTDGDGGISWETERVVKVDVVSTSIVYFKMTLDGIAPYMSYWGVSPSQLPALAWELIPYSFVADWFVNVGDWLRAISPNLFTAILGRCTSQVVEYTVKVTASKPVCYGWFLKSQSPSVYNWSARKLVRNIDASTSALPTFNPNWYKLNRLVDSLALTWGALRRHAII